MTVSYDSTLDDLVEVAVRRYLRSKAASSGRLRGALMWGAVFGLLALIGFHSNPGVNLPVVCLAAAAWGVGLVMITYNGSVRRRIAKYVAAEAPGPWPRPATFEIAEGRLQASFVGASNTHALADLSSVSDDANSSSSFSDPTNSA